MDYLIHTSRQNVTSNHIVLNNEIEISGAWETIFFTKSELFLYPRDFIILHNEV